MMRVLVCVVLAVVVAMVAVMAVEEEGRAGGRGGGSGGGGANARLGPGDRKRFKLGVSPFDRRVRVVVVPIHRMLERQKENSLARAPINALSSAFCARSASVSRPLTLPN